jgi:CrcB protein
MDRVMAIAGVAAGGAAGAVLRYVVSDWVQARVDHSFAWGTLAVNLAGCLLIGLLFQVMHERLGPEHPLRLMLIAGFLGAMTTYSTFAFESLRFIQLGQWYNAFGNLVVKTVLGLVFCFVGMWLGKLVNS